MQNIYPRKSCFILLNGRDISTYLNAGFMLTKTKGYFLEIMEFIFFNLTNSSEYRITRKLGGSSGPIRYRVACRLPRFRLRVAYWTRTPRNSTPLPSIPRTTHQKGIPANADEIPEATPPD